MKVPQGVEKVVALATLSPEWRAKVLDNPVAAAAEAGIELSEAEREILRSVSPRTLAGMIDSFGKTVPRPAGLARLAAGAAVVALLSSSLIGCDGCSPATRGDRADVPPPNPRKEEPPPPATKGIRPDIPPAKSAEPKPAPPPASPQSEEEIALKAALASVIKLYRDANTDGVNKLAASPNALLMWVAKDPSDADQLKRMREFGDFLAKTETRWRRPSPDQAIASFGPEIKAYHVRFIRRDGKWLLDEVNGGD